MRTLLLTALLLLITPHPRGDGLVPGEGGVYLDPTKPTVYLSVERVEEGGALWLRLHNNTRRAVGIRIIYTSPEPERKSFAFADGRSGEGLADGTKADLAYLVESPLFEGYPLREHGSCEKAEAWLPSGHAIVFSVDRAHLARYCRVSVGFNYEWEDRRVEPEHRVTLTWVEGERVR